MPKATVNKKILDTLIRAKVATLASCADVRPLPVMWHAPDATGINWVVSGWAGETDAVRTCMEQIQSYLHLLRAHFEIPNEAPR